MDTEQLALIQCVLLFSYKFNTPKYQQRVKNILFYF